MAIFTQVKDKNPNIETYLSKVSYAESRNNPNAKNPYGSATGLFQFVEGTWKNLTQKYGLNYSLEDRKNPEKAANVMRLFTEENERQIRPVVGRELNDGDRYLAHFLGAGGANKFFRAYNANPNAPISTVMSQNALDSNKNVVYNKDGSLKTVGDVYKWASEKMDTKVKPQIYADTYKPQPKSEKQEFPEIAKYSTPLETSTAEYIETEEEPVAVQEAKEDIAQKSFVEEYSKVFQSQEQEIQPEQPQEQYFSPDMPDPYNYIASEPLMEEFQIGGTLRDNIPTLQRNKVEYDPSYLSPRQFTEEYIQSPKYRERLLNSGYQNVDKEITNRLNNVRNVEIIKQDGKPNRFETYYKDFLGENYSTTGSQYSPTKNSIVMDSKTDNSKGETIYDNTPQDVEAHEIFHAEIDNFQSGLNEKDFNELFDRNRQYKVSEDFSNEEREKMRELHPTKMPHELSPSESRADMNSLRYMLKKAGIYDAGTQEFTKEHLDKLPSNFLKDRLRYRYKDEDLIWLMNNVAMNEDNSEIRFAQEGAIIDSRGQWAHPGEVTIIPGNDITMQGVNYPVLGIDNLGNQKMMYPGEDYQFKGDYVTEYPQIKNRKTNRFI